MTDSLLADGAFTFPVVSVPGRDATPALGHGQGVTFAALPGSPEPDRSALEESFAAELDRLRGQARTQGYSDGLAAGRADGEAQVAAAVAAAVAASQIALAAERASVHSAANALTAAAASVHRLYAPAAEDMAATLGSSAYALAEAIIGRDLDEAVSAAADAVDRALRLCPADGPVTVRVHPDDLGGVHTYGDVLADRVALVADATVERGGAVASFGATEVDAQISGALARAKKVLGA